MTNIARYNTIASNIKKKQANHQGLDTRLSCLAKLSELHLLSLLIGLPCLAVDGRLAALMFIYSFASLIYDLADMVSSLHCLPVWLNIYGGLAG